MNKTYKYTILTIFAALVFSFGIMAGMKLILQTGEKKILTEKGKAVVEMPVREWQGQKTDTEGKSKGISDKRILTTEQIEEVISHWNGCVAMAVHNPVNGQISMEEAIKGGEEWIAKMGFGRDGQEKEVRSVYAALGIASQEESTAVQLEPYYSFWKVEFSSHSMQAILYVNAITGKVWGADITLYESFPEEMPYEKLRSFAELSGLEFSDYNVAKNQEETQVILGIDGSHLYAKMEFQHLQSGYLNNGNGERREADSSREMLYEEGINIIFTLNLNKGS
jgi:hypothetical protein